MTRNPRTRCFEIFMDVVFGVFIQKHDGRRKNPSLNFPFYPVGATFRGLAEISKRLQPGNCCFGRFEISGVNTAKSGGFFHLLAGLGNSVNSRVII